MYNKKQIFSITREFFSFSLFISPIDNHWRKSPRFSFRNLTLSSLSTFFLTVVGFKHHLRFFRRSGNVKVLQGTCNGTGQVS
ncbi:hypothetical protein POTOM_029017 [Populus tomentosa]|uniref:Uncharacterized protein n=1 Tax=Populus tomentosa TaxID=118781 RepID=A0A8X7ZEK0_POPTO|nr:hypothetical protein POTOM_029017 [Populus tomentosa]